MSFISVSAAFMALLVRTRGSSLRHDAVNLFFCALCGIFAGAWLLYALLNAPVMISNWSDIRENFSLYDSIEIAFGMLGGAVFYGGVFGGMGAMFIYSKVFSVPLSPYLDLLAPIAPIAHGIGRVGCFLSGCCYGVPVSPDHPLAVTYPQASLAAPAGVSLLAVPLIEAVTNLLISFGLFLYSRHCVHKRPGAVAILYLLTYALTRFIIEFYRGDAIRGFFLSWSTSQWISIAIIICSAALLLYRQRGERAA